MESRFQVEEDRADNGYWVKKPTSFPGIYEKKTWISKESYEAVRNYESNRDQNG